MSRFTPAGRSGSGVRLVLVATVAASRRRRAQLIDGGRRGRGGDDVM
jgi:hypothetical protein